MQFIYIDCYTNYKIQHEIYHFVPDFCITQYIYIVYITIKYIQKQIDKLNCFSKHQNEWRKKFQQNKQLIKAKFISKNKEDKHDKN